MDQGMRAEWESAVTDDDLLEVAIGRSPTQWHCGGGGTGGMCALTAPGFCH